MRDSVFHVSVGLSLRTFCSARAGGMGYLSVELNVFSRLESWGLPGRDQFVTKGKSSKEDGDLSLLPAASGWRGFWIFCPRECFLSGRLFIFQLSCPGLVLTRHLGMLWGTVKNPARPSGAHSLVQEMGASGAIARALRRDGPSICRGTEARGLWASDRGDLGSATAGVQRSEG